MCAQLYYSDRPKTNRHWSLFTTALFLSCRPSPSTDPHFVNLPHCFPISSSNTFFSLSLSHLPYQPGPPQRDANTEGGEGIYIKPGCLFSCLLHFFTLGLSKAPGSLNMYGPTRVHILKFLMNRFHETDTVARSYYSNSRVSMLIHAIQYRVNHSLNCVVFL